MHLLLASLIFISINTQAAITIEGVAGVSNFVNVGDSSDTTVPQIFGGTAGTSCTAASNFVTCSSCSDNGLTGDSRFTVCNASRIRSNLYIQISFKSDTTGGRPTITDSTGATAISMDASLSTAQVVKDQVGTIFVLWQTICENLGTSSGGCDDNATFTKTNATFKIGIAADNSTLLNGTGADSTSVSITVKQGSSMDAVTSACGSVDSTDGVCGFNVVPGDKKVFIEQVRAGDSFPNGASIQYKKVRVFYGSVPNSTALDTNICTGITMASASQDLTVSAETPGVAKLTPNKVTGLENNRNYCFKVATVDEAGNVGYFTPDSLDGTCYANGSTTVDSSSIACHLATPGEVLGVLAKSENCFIATAAFGSKREHHVVTLRQFRGDILMKNWLGRKFVRWYYEWSPEAVEQLRSRPYLLAATRVALIPVALFAELALKIGFLGSITLLAAFLALVIFAVTRLANRKVALSIMLAILVPLASSTAFAQEELTSEDFNLEDAELTAEDEAPPPAEFPYPNAKEPEFQNPAPVAVVESAPPVAIEQPISRSETGTYFYAVQNSEVEGSFSLRMGLFTPPSIQNPRNLAKFKDLYGKDNIPVLFVDYEWYFTRRIGHLGLKLTTGFFGRPGEGRFAEPSRSAERPRESFTFILVPNSIAAVYKFRYVDKQIFIPYVDGGAGYYGFAEIRDDGQAPKFGGAAALVASAGAIVQMDWLDEYAIRNLDRDYGVNHVSLIGEYKQIVSLNKDYDISAQVISAGVNFEF